MALADCSRHVLRANLEIEFVISPYRKLSSSLMKPHRIRLHKAWRLTPLVDASEMTVEGTAAVKFSELPTVAAEAGQPWSLPLTGFRTLGRYERVFHAPSNILPTDQIFLVCEGFDAVATIVLNGHLLGRFTAESIPVRLEITRFLAENCYLQIDVELPAIDLAASDVSQAPKVFQRGGLTGLVYLEIFSFPPTPTHSGS
jgi:hypothetical protein